jgi:hypothetical protein
MKARLLTILAGLTLAAQQIAVQADVEKRTVAVGEPFLLQIRIDGSDAPAQPDVSGLADFSVEDLGSQQTSSESVTIVDNRVRREVRRGRVYTFRLAARKPGALVIPPISIAVGGRQLRTAPIPIRVTPPVEDEDLKLRLTPSSLRLYVGEPAVLTLTWYIGRAVRDFRFDWPVLSDRRFRVADPPVRFDPDKHLEVALAGGRALAEKGVGRLNGREMATLTLRKILIPLEPGSLVLAPATVAGQVLRETQPRRGPSLFDELFGEGFFDFGRRPMLESFSVASDSLRLEVRPLPEANRPAEFTGLVGEFRIEAQAKPTDVTVGDPITLTLRVSGPDYVGHVQLPPLARQPELARDFKVPEEPAPGEVEDGVKKFTEIIRVMNPGVSRIPPIALTYFNPKTGRYEVARTDPIALTVREARVVTAQDAEGAGGAPAGQSEIASREGGIAHNYEGPDVLVNVPAGPETWFESRTWLAVVLLPPLVYLSLAAWAALARRRADQARQRAGGAFKRLARRLRSVEQGGSDGVYSALLDGLRRYFRDRFDLPAGALTFRDLKPVLEQRGVAPETIEAVGKLFERCEAGHYGAPVAEADPPELVREALETAEKVERTLP